MGTRGRSDTAGWTIIEQPSERRKTLSGSLTDLLTPWRNGWSFDPKSISLFGGKKRRSSRRPGELFANGEIHQHIELGDDSRLLPILTFVLLVVSALLGGGILTVLLSR